MKRFFHAELQEFRSNLVIMGERAVEIVRLAVRAMEEEDFALCEEVLALDDALDKLEVLIDNEGIRYISLRAPVASELRLLTVGMRFGQDLERVGDEACTVAKRVRSILNTGRPCDFSPIIAMGQKVVDMLREAVDCFLEESPDPARDIPVRDGEIDRIHRGHYERFSQACAEHPGEASHYLDLVFISKSLERIGDHAANLAEEVVYLYRGEDLRHSPELKERKRHLKQGDDPA